MRTANMIFAAMVAATLAGCGNRDKAPELMNIRSSSQGPDEFAILPPKSLTLPTDMKALPEPTPGGGNLTDPTPNADAIVALGGRAESGVGGDAGLMNHVSRYGVAGGIRGTLAGEDLQWRRDNNGRILERLFNVNSYYRAYRTQSLDQQAELFRWRKRGVKTPSAPPPQPGE